MWAPLLDYFRFIYDHKYNNYFNIICFDHGQLWRLNIPVLEYSSRFEDDLGPVTHFAYQEPENDPKNFCYVWVARGAMVTDSM